MHAAMAARGYSYRLQDLAYRAVSVANIKTLFGAYISAGKSYEFGDSVRDGVKVLRSYYAEVMARCPETRWVLAGYSQGAMVVAEAVRSFWADKVIYIGLFGDPQLSLPEGKGLFPDACRGKNLSPYRVKVPECRTNKGALGMRNPYQYGELAGKYGLWCAREDYICGSSRNPLKNDGHLGYAQSDIARMRDYVLMRLPKRTFSRSSVRLAAETRSAPHAVLPLAEYYAADGAVTFDASASYSLDDEIVQYEWDFGDGWMVGEAVMERSFANDTLIRLRVTNSAGESDVVEAWVFVRAPGVDMLAPPELIVTKDTDGIAHALAINPPSAAQYLLVSLNGHDLGYYTLDQQIRIGELQYGTDEWLSFAYMDADLNVGESYDLALLDIELDETISPTEEGVDVAPSDPEGAAPVATGVEPWCLWFLAPVGLGLVIFGTKRRPPGRRAPTRGL